MRCALILPAPIAGWGGVQRFGGCLSDALASLWSVRTFHLHPKPGASRLRALVAGTWGLYNDHRKNPFDVVITMFHWPPRLLPAPMVGVIHDLRLLDTGMVGAKTAAQRAILRTWDLVLVPTEHVRDEVMSLGCRRPVVVIGEGTDHLDRFVPPTAVGRRDHLVVLAGRADHKRGELGLQTAEEVVARLGVRAIVVGPTARVPRDDRILVLPAPSDDEVASAHLGARVVLAPSRYEGFGLAVGEALRLGAPVVFAGDGTLGPLVKGGGLSAAPTPAAMADAVERAWQDFEALSAQARMAVRHLTWEATARTVVGQVERLTKLSSPGARRRHQ